MKRLVCHFKKEYRMEKLKLTTTLNDILEFNPCDDGLKLFLSFVGCDYPKDKEINLLTILESNGISDFFWCFKTLKENKKEAFKILSLICKEIAESVLHIYENKYPNDLRPREALQALELFINDKITIHILLAAKNAAYAAAHTAYAAAYAAANAADVSYAAHTAYAAAYAAANAADVSYAAHTAYAAAYAAANAADVSYADAAHAAYAAAHTAYDASNAAYASAAVKAKEGKKQIEIIKKYLE
jgi:hypothetical protein